MSLLPAPICLVVSVLLVSQAVKSEGPTIASNVNCSVVHRQSEAVPACCVFPFIYQGVPRDSCIPGDPGHVPWCSTTVNYDVDQQRADCPGTHPNASSADATCNRFPSGIAHLAGGSVAADQRWRLQCNPGQAVTSLMEEYQTTSGSADLRDVRCCNGPVYQNISHVFSNMSDRTGGSVRPNEKWMAQCSDNFVLTGLHSAEKATEASTKFGEIDAMKCSLLIGYRVLNRSCMSVTMAASKPESTSATWGAECPNEYFITAVYSDRRFFGIKTIKCCPIETVSYPYKPCAFEDGICATWSAATDGDISWKIGDGAGIGIKDHTIGRTTGHVLYATTSQAVLTPNTAVLASIGLPPSSSDQCISLWYRGSAGSKLTISALLYDAELGVLLTDDVGSVEDAKTSAWTEIQGLLPDNTKHQPFQILIDGIVSQRQSWLVMDDFQFKPKKFCTGVCWPVGPLQGSTSTHVGKMILWQATCLHAASAGDETSALTGLWEKLGSRFHVVEYLRCCYVPLVNSQSVYSLSLIDKTGGPIAAHAMWNAQCKLGDVVTGIFSLNMFHGLYEIQCGKLAQAQTKLNYSACVVVWSEVRDHAGVEVSRHLECPAGTVIVALYDHLSDNNITYQGFLDVDAIKCCQVEVSSCQSSSDCHSNADCVNSTIKRCVCRDGYHGNGKFCRRDNPVFPPTSPSKTTIRVVDTTHTTEWLTTASEGSEVSTVAAKVVVSLAAVTKPALERKATDAEENSSVVMVGLSVTAAGLIVLLIVVVIVWGTRRRRIGGIATPKEYDMHAPMSEMTVINNLDSSSTGDVDELGVLCSLTESKEKLHVVKKPRSGTLLSIEHAYVSEEDLEPSPVTQGPLYFELDKNSCYKTTYSLCSTLALPEPLYGVLEPDVPEDEGVGAYFCQPASNEQELYQQLSREIPRDRVEVGVQRLGSGCFGHVLLGVWQKSPGIAVQVAIKMLRDSSSTDDRIKFLQEAAIMRQFSHSNVVFMYGVATRGDPIMIVLEYMSRGSLKKYLRQQRSKLGTDPVLHQEARTQFLSMARDIAAGMHYLHSLAFVHRDLAARNVLLDADMNCKIGDFGMSRDLVLSDYYRSSGGRIPVKWTAPEAINYRRYSSASDVWSYGIVLYEIWSLGLKPYAELDNNEVIEAVSQGFRLPPPDHCPQMFYRLMVDTWHPDSQSRPTSSQIHHCLCFSDQQIFLDNLIPQGTHRAMTGCCRVTHEEKESSSNSRVTNSHLQHVYAATRKPVTR